jgi:cell division septum initiation protein DivIVA
MTLEEQADELLRDHQLFHDSFQICHFIVGKAGNAFGRYRQCLREIDARRRRQREIDRALRRATLKLNQIRCYPMTPEAKIDQEEIEEQLADMRACSAGIERELAQFVAIASSLKRELGDLDEEKRYALEAEHWVAVLGGRLRAELIATGTVSTDTMMTIAALPDDLRERVLELPASLKDRFPNFLLEE